MVMTKRPGFLALLSRGSCVLLLALASCSGPERRPLTPVDEEFARLEGGARQAHSRGEVSYARDLYQALLIEAERSDDPSKIGDTAFNLAVCQLALGEFEEARDLFLIAEHELGRAREPLAQVFLARARLALFDGKAEECRSSAEMALLDKRSRARARERAESHVLIGLASIELRQLDAAQAALEGAHEEADDDEAAPSTYRLEARLHQANGRPTEAALSFDSEAERAGQWSLYETMADAHELAGDAWHDVGDMDRARDRWLRAARCRFARAVRRGSSPQVELRELQAATELCARVDDADALAADPMLEARLRYLVQRIEVERERIAGVVQVLEAERQARELAEEVSE
ncbi:MAG: tetratricopeptide (TPR) repeat protein [Planctomycetota bacterium]|jgi:tetratricopeptide (TPR) repeat protein